MKAGDEGVDIGSVHGLERLARDVNDIAYSDNRITRAGTGSGAQRGLQMGPAFQVASGGAKSPRESGMPQVLNALDHVVVVMFENRSFANLLGRLYEPGEVASFAGVIGKDLPNPVSDWAEHRQADGIVRYSVAPDMNTPNPMRG